MAGKAGVLILHGRLRAQCWNSVYYRFEYR
jgi:hypothetical protein